MLDALSKPKIKQKLQTLVADLIDSLEVLEQVDSTNLQLKRTGITDKFKVCIANTQTAGKGRQGRRWLSPTASNIYFSISRAFTISPASLSSLSLVVGILCTQALEKLTGFNQLQIKWPNDLIAKNKKLGGILIENHIDHHQKSAVIIGIGINISMASDSAIDTPWINLQDVSNTVERNQIISALLNHLIPNIHHFNDKTLGGMMTDWDELDWLKNQEVKLFNKTKTIYGTAVGISPQGALRLEREGKIQEIYSGDLSLRKSHVTA